MLPISSFSIICCVFFMFLFDMLFCSAIFVELIHCGRIFCYIY
nr:MAG TPA: hypothetical protein [Herelleviridae sp.]